MVFLLNETSFSICESLFVFNFEHFVRAFAYEFCLFFSFEKYIEEIFKNVIFFQLFGFLL